MKKQGYVWLAALGVLLTTALGATQAEAEPGTESATSAALHPVSTGRQADHWGAPKTALVPQGDPAGLSCAEATRCVSVDGFGTAQWYDGSRWSRPKTIDSDGLAGVSCPNVSFCLAIDDNSGALVYDGSDWSNPTVVGGGDISWNTVSCATAEFCVAAGRSFSDQHGYAAVFDGQHWTSAVQVSDSGSVRVSCPSTSFCLLVDAQGDASTFDGTTWSAPSAVDPGQPLVSVSCASASLCRALDESGQVLTYDAGGWSTPQPVDGPSTGVSLSCATSDFCVALLTLDHNRTAALTFDGTAWSAPKIVDTSRLVWAGVECADQGACTEVNNDVSSVGTGTVLAQGTWASTPDLDVVSAGTLVSVSCPTAAFCAAVDNLGNAVTSRNGHWARPTHVDTGTGSFFRVSCSSARHCAAVGKRGFASIYDGTSWSPPTQLTDDFNGLLAVGCASSTFCVAMGEDGDSYVHDGAQWSAAIPVGMADPVSVSCPTARFCAAVGGAFGAPYGVLFDGTTWGQVRAIDTDAALTSVSCAQARACLAVDVAGNTVALTGRSWSAPQASDTGLHFLGVSCPTTTVCRAVGDTGAVARRQDGHWGSAHQVAPPAYTQPRISCGTSSTCVVVDISGHAERLG